jgi:hypothetical protein
MKTFGTVLLVALLATAANAAPNPEKCRSLAATYQNFADELGKSSAALSEPLGSMSLPKYPSIPADTPSAAESARLTAMNALGAYRNALDAVASDMRACKPKN